eukprot:12084855-Prorocentrum_lima.AAC.1
MKRKAMSFMEWPGTPLDKWMAAGEPIITTKHWVELCMKIAAGHMKNLGKIMSVCTDMDAKR